MRMGSWIKFKPSKSPLFAIANGIPLHWMYSQWILWCVQRPNRNSQCEFIVCNCIERNSYGRKLRICEWLYILFEVKLSHDKSKSCIHAGLSLSFSFFFRNNKRLHNFYMQRIAISIGTYKFKAHRNQTVWVLWIFCFFEKSHKLKMPMLLFLSVFFQTNQPAYGKWMGLLRNETW